jgi:hypothetical protein
MITPVYSTGASNPLTTYELRLAGHLDDRWSAWLEARHLVRDDDACTTLTVDVADQAQLHGLLSRIRDMGVTLLSLSRSDA